MSKELSDDIKKYQKAEKLKKWREEVQPIPWYFDGLENLCDRIHPGKQSLRVTDIKELSHDTKLYRFISANPNKDLAPFRAGQYIGLTVEINGVRTSRPFSLVSSPNQLAYYELGIKRKEGGFVSPYILDIVKVGDVFESTEPMGNLYYNPIFHGKDLVFIAGGSGITPFISMLRNISERSYPLNVHLIFGCVTEKEILFREELEDIKARRPNIKIEFILSETNTEWAGACGFISKDIILNNIGTIKDKYFYVVGNREMYQFIQGELNTLGVPRHRAIYEEYGVPDDITKIMGWPEEIDASKKIQITVEFFRMNRKEKKVIEAPCIEPLLNSLERAKLGIQIESGCRSGACALYRTKMKSGKVFVPPDVTIREVDRDYGFIHPCISYPISDVYIDLTLT